MIAIIGGGFSGSMVAIHLLQKSKNSLRIKLIERAPEAGRGVAYGTPVQSHLLNVPAAKMSAFPDHSEHFLQWLQSREQSLNIGTIHAGMFAPRRVYGDYLQSILQETVADVDSPARLERVTAEAVSIEESYQGAIVHLNTGESVHADKVVLALGNFPSSLPIPVKRSSSIDQCVKEAWSWQATDNLDSNDPVLLVGTGLTMVDTVVTLRQQGHRGQIYAVSRHGLLPQSHKATEAHSEFLTIEQAPQTIRALLRRVRQEIQTSGKDWRAVIDTLRPITQELWQNLPLKEQKRFLRHVKSYWEVYRHRIAPEIAAALDELLQSGQLRYYAGRIQVCQETGNGIAVTLRQRGTVIQTTLNVCRIINCTGSNANYRKLQHPLVASLQEQRLIRSSALTMGIDTAENGAVINADGHQSHWLFTLGTALKGKLWETNAVPELRGQAQAVAEELCKLPFIKAYVEPKLIFRQLFDLESCTYTYLIADARSRQAILVDPVLEQLDRDLQMLRELGLALKYCIETHVHADHITGAGRLRSRTGCQIIVPEGAPVEGADYKIAHAEILRLGAVEMIAIATPGHTDSHMAYLVNETQLLTGDALFIRGCGRTDFQGGAAESLYDTVTEKLFSFPDETLVYPGHDYQGRTVSTIGEEKRWNLRFAQRERSEFVELMTALKLPYPKKMRQAVPANEACGMVPPESHFQPELANALLVLDPKVFAGMYI
ncbi:MAG: FAD-dependent oxidoreductase [Plectolyngbya sp. WJT66-NPBG17]|jgi:uncharacterized NAD(P)/FAD-binding protein YdhS/glyoxylase-like metal-dependent hydrolase (beta-lactamase superfamily II)|nr:FAD-dependent oxidoreductase [Plectolyngbya sp. WJT66-NPBG17]